MENRCQSCGNIFVHVDKRRKFCTYLCYSKSKKKNKICSQCGVEFPQRSHGKKFCSGKCYGVWRRGKFTKDKHPQWKGGITYTNGYKMRFRPEHPYADTHGYVMEHRLVMEKIIGRYLDPINEVVHHKDEDRQNNNPNNLQLMSRIEHINHHRPTRYGDRVQ